MLYACPMVPERLLANHGSSRCVLKHRKVGKGRSSRRLAHGASKSPCLAFDGTTRRNGRSKEQAAVCSSLCRLKSGPNLIVPNRMVAEALGNLRETRAPENPGRPPTPHRGLAARHRFQSRLASVFAVLPTVGMRDNSVLPCPCCRAAQKTWASDCGRIAAAIDFRRC